MVPCKSQFPSTKPAQQARRDFCALTVAFFLSRSSLPIILAPTAFCRRKIYTYTLYILEVLIAAAFLSLHIAAADYSTRHYQGNISQRPAKMHGIWKVNLTIRSFVNQTMELVECFTEHNGGTITQLPVTMQPATYRKDIGMWISQRTTLFAESKGLGHAAGRCIFKIAGAGPSDPPSPWYTWCLGHDCDDFYTSAPPASNATGEPHGFEPPTRPKALPPLASAEVGTFQPRASNRRRRRLSARAGRQRGPRQHADDHVCMHAGPGRLRPGLPETRSTRSTGAPVTWGVDFVACWTTLLSCTVDITQKVE